jgi:hypothetical protein
LGALHLDLRIERSSINPGQWALLTSTADAVLMSGGFGSGKTTGGSLKVVQLWAENPKVDGLVISPTYKSLWAVTYPRLMATFRRALPPHLQPQLRDKQGACYLEMPDGARIYLRSATNPASFDGIDVGWLWGDELRHWTQRAYQVALGRVRVRCPRPQKVFTSTPAMHWMADDYHHRRSPHRQLITAPTRENERNLAPGFVEKLRLSYSPRLQKIVIDGLFAVLEGAVYEQLDPDFWHSPWVMDYDTDLTRYHRISLAFDPGYRRSALLWMAEFSPRRWVCFDEHMGDNQSDAALVELINSKPWPIDEIWVDPAADATQSTLALDTLDMLDAVGLRPGGEIRHVVAPFRGIAFGVDKLRTLFGDPERGQAIRLFAARRLQQVEEGWNRGFVKDALSYHYPETKDGRPISNEPLKDGVTDHSMDAVRNWAVGMCLTNPELRDLDYRIDELAAGRAGYRIVSR